MESGQHSSENIEAAEWYYVGHYGQLGPLTLQQMTELSQDGVITGGTYVWKNGMSDWSPASAVQDLAAVLGPEEPPMAPSMMPPIAPSSAPPTPD